MILTRYYDKNYNPADTSIPVFVYVTDSMYRTMKTNGFLLDPKAFLDLDKVRDVFTDAQLAEWVIEVYLVLPSMSATLPLWEDIKNLMGISNNDIFGKRVDSKMRQCTELLAHFTRDIIDRLNAENYKESKTGGTLFERDTQSQIIFIHPHESFGSITQVRRHIRNSSFDKVISASILEVMYNNPLGYEPLRKLDYQLTNLIDRATPLVKDNVEF